MLKLFLTCLLLSTLGISPAVSATSATNAANAANIVDAMNTPALEKRLVEIAEQLRCLVCQNQSIAESQSDLAKDLRSQVRQMLVQGKSDKEISDFMVQRYGDFILYRPPIKSVTWLLWFGPFFLLVSGLTFLVLRSKAERTTNAISADNLGRASTLLSSTSESKEEA